MNCSYKLIAILRRQYRIILAASWEKIYSRREKRPGDEVALKFLFGVKRCERTTARLTALQDLQSGKSSFSLLVRGKHSVTQYKVLKIVIFILVSVGIDVGSF